MDWLTHLWFSCEGNKIDHYSHHHHQDCFEGKWQGASLEHLDMSWDNPGFMVDFHANQSIEQEHPGSLRQSYRQPHFLSPQNSIQKTRVSGLGAFHGGKGSARKQEKDLSNLNHQRDIQWAVVCLQSINGGFHKWGYPQLSSILIELSIKNHPFWATTIYENPIC